VDQQNRFHHCPELVAVFDAVFLTRTRDEWMDIFLEHRLMFSSVQQIDEVFTDVQALANGYITTITSSSLGELKIPGYPIHFGANRAGMRSFAPHVGEHTDIVLKELGYEAAEIESLKQDGVVCSKPS
jgi:crotonobetainyl-CoA:carnitine CoA-transferase CaiB-like acyl-CoA transferase